MLQTIMDLIDGMRTFTQVVSSGSFTAAGDRLGISKKLVSKYIAQLEDRLETRLLNRTTRSLSLTEAGTQYHARCLQLIDDLDELELSLQSQTDKPRGKLFVSAPTTFGEIYLVPLIIKFRERYPEVTIDLRLNDRFVNIVDEGFDLAIRIGSLEDSSLIARKLMPSSILLCASPEYLDRKGTPLSPHDLLNHDCIIDSNFRSGNSWPFIISKQRINLSIDGNITINSARSARDFALSGNGIALCPSYVIGPEIKSGALIAVLEDYLSYDFDVFVIYNNTRNLAPKVRAFMDFLAYSLGE